MSTDPWDHYLALYGLGDDKDKTIALQAAEIERLRKKVERVAAIDDDIGVYPKAIKGFNDERDYEQRDGFKNGWNAAAMEIMRRISEALEQ